MRVHFHIFMYRSCQERYGNPRGRELAMVRTLALCHNAIIHAKWVVAPNQLSWRAEFIFLMGKSSYLLKIQWAVKQDPVSFSCRIHTMETPPGCSSSIRDGFPPSLPLKVCLLNLMLCLRVQSHWLCWIFQLDEELLDFLRWRWWIWIVYSER